MPKYTVIINGKEKTIDKDKFDRNVEAISVQYPDAKIKAINGDEEGLLPVSNYSKAIEKGYRMVELKNDIPDSRFVQGKGEDTTIFGVPYSIYTQMKPKSQSHYYQKALDEEREQERKQMKEQAASVKRKADEQHVSAMGDKVQADYDAVMNNPFLAINDPMMGVEMKTPSQTKSQKKVELTRASSERAGDTFNMIEEAGRKGNTSFVSGFGRGFWEKVSKASNWDFGGRDMQANMAIASAAKKYEAGQPLSDEEENLLDAVALEAAANGEFSGDLGRGYKAGMTTAESLPFMAEFMINPATGTGKAISKAAAKKVITNFGKEAAKSTIGKIARSSAHVAGDIAGAGIMTGTTGAMRMSADAVDRMTGNITPVIDADGYFHFSGTDGGEGVWESLAKAYGASTIENFSEMFGNYLAPIGGAFATGAGKVMNKIGLGRVNKVIGDIKSSDVAKIIDDFQSKTQWNGTIGEYLEEQAGMAMNALTVGDNNLSDMVDPDVQIDTFLGVSALGGLFSGIKSVGYAREKYSAKNKLNEADRFASHSINNNQEWMDLKKRIDEADDAELVSILSGVIKREGIEDEVKQAVLMYAGRLKAYHGASLADLKRKTEGDTPDEVVQSQINFDAGYRLAEADRNEKRKAFREMLETEKKLDNEFLSGDDSKQYDLMKQRADAGEDVSYELAYINARSRFRGMIQGVRDVIDEKVARSNEYITNVTHQDGNVYDITLSSDENKHVFPVNGNPVFDENGLIDKKSSDSRFIVRDDKGNIEMRPVEDLYKLESSSNAELLKDITSQTIREQESARHADDIETPSDEEKAEEVAAIQPGDIISLDMQGVKVGATVQSKKDGSTVLQLDDPIEYNGKKVQAIELPDEQLQAMIIPEQENGSNMVDFKSENEDFSPIEESNSTNSPIETDDPIKQEEGNKLEVGIESSLQGDPMNTVTIPIDDKGNMLYHKAPVEMTIADLNDGNLTVDEVDSFVSANKEEATKLLKKTSEKPPKIGTNKAKYLEEKKKWTDTVADINSQIAYWNEVEAQLQAIRENPGDTTASDIKAMGEPLNGLELAAMMLGAGKLPLLYNDYKRETGFGNSDARGMFGMFSTKENGGMTVEQAGEQLMLVDMEAGTNFFDQDDPNAGRNAILDVLSSARTRGDLVNYVRNNREVMSEREKRAEYEAYERWCNDTFHMTPEEYEAYEEVIADDLAKRILSEEEYNEFMSTFVDEQNMNNNEQQGITREGENSSEVLQGEESIQTRGTGGIKEESSEVNSGVIDENGVIPESASGGEIESNDEKGDREESENKQVNVEFIAPPHMEGESIIDYAERVTDAHLLHKEEKKVDTNPTEGQKEAGNYRKGHIKIDGFDITIENPRGSERSGVDADGKPWSVTMNNTYGYIRGTEGVDGDHIDVFIGNSGNGVYVVDQVKKDGSFDEHKVMYGFGSMEEAREAYLSNYSPGWKGLGNITGVSKDVFKDWIESSHRKTKPFTEDKNTIVEGEYHPKDNTPILFTHTGELSLKKGEFCHVERVFTESKSFLFTGKEKIESADDVAYIFRELENSSIENSFAVLVKDKKPTIVHLGMGAFTSTVANVAAIRAAYDAVGADNIYFVHNHPSGKLKCSMQDVGLLKNIVDMFESEDVIVQDGIIINTISGQYGTFDLHGINEDNKRPDRQEELPLRLYAFDKLVFSKKYDPSNLSKIRSSEDIAALISSQRLGNRKKVSYLILDNANHVLGNLHTTFSSVKKNEKSLAGEIAQNTIRFGGTSAVIYGSFDMKEFSPRDLNRQIKRLSAGSVQLLDCISINGKNAKSAVDDSLMEPENVYKPSEIKEQIDNEKLTGDDGKRMLTNKENLFDSAERIVEQERINRNYDDAVNAVNEFHEKCSGACKTLVIKSKDTLRSQMEAIHIESEDSNKYEKWFDENKTAAFYAPKYELVIVLDTNYSKEDLNAYLWHENVHAALKGMDNQYEVIEDIIPLIDKYARFIIDKVDDVYTEESDYIKREEYVTHFFEELIKSGKESLMLNGDVRLNDTKVNEAIKEILNYINNGREKDYAGSRGDIPRRRARNDGRSEPGLDREVRNSEGNVGYEEEGGRMWNDLRSILNEGEERLRRKTEEESTSSGVEDSSSLEREGMAQRMYEDSLDRVKNKMYRWQEAYQDSMLGLKKLQEAIVKESGRTLKYFEDAYMAENQMSSQSSFETEVYKDKFMNPLMDAIKRIIDKGVSRGEVNQYVMAKHGLERNEVFAKRDAELAANEEFDEKISDVHKLFDEGGITHEEWEEKIDGLKALKEEFYEKEYANNRKKDYSGLTQLTEDTESYEEIARGIVETFENRFDTNELWEKINLATKQTLRKSYESGLMTKATYKKVNSMFEYYVPLRGFKDKVASDVYDYILSDESPFNAPVQAAKGRESQADDPFANIGNMAESGILQGNRNLMKQKFLNMVLNHPTSLVTVKTMWYERVVTGNKEEWVESFPEIKEGATPDEVSDAIEEHERRMLDLQKDRLSVRSTSKINLNFRASNREKNEHTVVVKSGGKEYVIYINGNPRAAQAINGLTNPDVSDDKLMKGVQWLNRQMAANFTTRNPAFVLSNMSRDVIFSSSAIWIKEDWKYAKRFDKNIIKNIGAIPGLMTRHKSNKLDMRNSKDRFFLEFLENGGETGHTALHNVEEYKKMMDRYIKKTDGTWGSISSGAHAIIDAIDFMNRCAEDVSRFTTYQTSREMGRGIYESIRDAKEVTVNFNKKGAGMKSGGWIGWSAQTFKSLFLFFNAAMQSLKNFKDLHGKSKGKFYSSIGGFAAAGIVFPMINNAIIGMLIGDGDDDITDEERSELAKKRNAYDNLPDWVRKNNFCLWVGGENFITIPLPIELRAFYGLGEMWYQMGRGSMNGSNGNIDVKRATSEMVNQLTELLPINPLGGNGDVLSVIVPDAAKPLYQVFNNRDFFGKPIYKKGDYNENMPAWTKAYSGTATWMVNSTKFLNELSGGDKYTQGQIDWNPAAIEHVFENYFGGMGKTANQLYKTISMIWNEDERMWRNVLVANRFISGSDNKVEFRKVNETYYRYIDEYNKTELRLRGYENEAELGLEEYAEKLDFLYESKENERYQIIKDYKSIIDEIYKSIKESDPDEKKDLEMEINLLKMEMIDEISKMK